jgi:hypothetical protein
MSRTILSSLAFAVTLGIATMAAASERQGRPVNPTTQANVSSAIVKGQQKGKAGGTMRLRSPSRPVRRGPGEFVVPHLIK